MPIPLSDEAAVGRFANSVSGLDIADQFLDDFGIVGRCSQLYLTGLGADAGKEMTRAPDTSAQDVSSEQSDGGPAQAQ